MKIKAVTVISLILTMTRYVDGGKGGCKATPFDKYFLQGGVNLPQAIIQLSEIVYAPKRDAIYFQYAAIDSYFNNTKIAKLLYSTTSLIVEININGARTFAYDDLNDIIYVGTNDGLYAVDSEHRISETIIKESVISVFVKNGNIYYINGLNEVIVCKLNGGESYKIDLLDMAKLTRLVVNDKTDMVGITKKLGIMTLSHENGPIIHKTDTLGRPINLSVDNDIIYVYTTKGVYKMNSKGGLDFVSDFSNLQGLAFVNDKQLKKGWQAAVITAQDGTITIRPRYSTDPCQV